jgi:hypothetical protein
MSLRQTGDHPNDYDVQCDLCKFRFGREMEPVMFTTSRGPLRGRLVRIRRGTPNIVERHVCPTCGEDARRRKTPLGQLLTDPLLGVSS